MLFHTPARFKYLKSPQAELANSIDVMNKFALSYPSISFSLENNGKSLLHTSGNGSITDIVAMIYGLEIAKTLTFFSGNNRDYQISGFFADPIHNRSQKGHISVLVNRRVVRHNKIVNQFVEAFDQLLPLGRYPIGLIDITVDPLLIDVNIHPSKQEVKFSEETQLLALIQVVLEQSLNKMPVIQPALQVKSDQTSFWNNIERTPATHVYETPILEDQARLDIEEEKSIESPKTFPEFDYIGQFAGTYLLFQNDTGLFLLDQHAAAERIRYERYLDKMSSPQPETYDLLIPLPLHLSMDEKIRLQPLLFETEKFGIKMVITSENDLLIESIPTWFPKGVESLYAEAVVETLLAEKTLEISKLRDHLAKQLSCKHSLKANAYVNHEEAEQLVNQLRECNNPYTCPHGRPILVFYALREIEKAFKRVI